MDTFENIVRNIANFFFGSVKRVGYTFGIMLTLVVIWNWDTILISLHTKAAHLLFTLGALANDNMVLIILIVAIWYFLFKKKPSGGGAKKAK